MDCVSEIGEGMAQGALVGGVTTAEAGAAGALPGALAGIVVGATNC